MKIKLLLLLSFLGVLAVNCQTAKFQHKNPDIPLLNSWGNINIHHAHLTKVTGDVKAGDKIGYIQPFPDTLSLYFDNDLRLSMQFYKTGDYKKARAALIKAVQEDPDNFFVLENYARACYKIDTIESFKIYKKLVSNLDSTLYDPNYEFTVDLWHREAYWKLGTLYMDHYLWDKAYYEISRYLLTIQDQKGKFPYSQALEYLTECAFNLYDDDLTRYLANRTLYYDPKNEYVKELLQKIKK